jgi:sulfoxide reductase catalytic subunit YedY
MLIKRPADIPSSEITDEKLYWRRREFMRVASGAALGLAAGGVSAAEAPGAGQRPPKLEGVTKGPFGTTEAPTPYEDATTYNNFYELATDKASPARTAGTLRPRPWSVRVDGEVGKPGDYALDDLLKPHPLEERVYRLRCVEAWSMVIPWVGFPLGDLLKRFAPTSKARFVEFTTLNDRNQLPGLNYPVLRWPYREGLRLDEAMHPLTILAVGLYGVVLPNQNGAPLRLVVPWKYGFKSIKSIVRIRLVASQPVSSWEEQNPQEYGFYATVNPKVDHPRWSQAKERRVGESVKRDTLLFNGYGAQVAALYSGMDLAKYF